jgi:hypothetical protein
MLPRKTKGVAAKEGGSDGRKLAKTPSLVSRFPAAQVEGTSFQRKLSPLGFYADQSITPGLIRCSWATG